MYLFLFTFSLVSNDTKCLFLLDDALSVDSDDESLSSSSEGSSSSASSSSSSSEDEDEEEGEMAESEGPDSMDESTMDSTTEKHGRYEVKLHRISNCLKFCV